MEPITTAAIGAVLGEGLVVIAKKVLEKSVAEPAVDSVKKVVNRPLDRVREDKALQAAIEDAFQAAGAPKEEEAVSRYLLNLGLDPLLAPDNSQLRQEFARAALLMTEPKPDMVPDELLKGLRWPSSRRQFLADFLYALRNNLENDEGWGLLVHYADREDVRTQLRAMSFDVARTADATERTAMYLKTLLESRGIAADKPDARGLEEYVQYLLDANSNLSFLFIKPAGSRTVRTDAELETVFVPLQVYDPETVDGRNSAKSRVFTMDLQQLYTRAQHGDLLPVELADLPDILRTESERVQLLTIDQVLQRYSVFLLQGPPGSGKTTLLRHIAICFARGDAAEKLGWTGDPLLPILVPLRNFGRFLEEHHIEYIGPAAKALREFIEAYFAEHELELPPRFFRDRLNEGKCLIMLDGLDEVADRDLRVTVAQMVSAFIKNYEARGNRFGFASRPRGYEEIAIYLPKPVVCLVQPLTPDGRDELATNLLAVLETNPQRRQQNTVDLLADIRAKAKVDELSRNPLFCTTLVLVFKYRGTTLPERRVDVYHELVELLLGFWDIHRAEREGTSDVRELVLVDGTGRDFMDERDAVEAKARALTALADWMQRSQQSEVPQLRAAARLARFFRNVEGASREEDKAWACNFLAVAHQRSGLLIESQPGVFSFSHQNFREYLAATSLVDRLDHDMVRIVLENAGDPWWEEVILLAAAHPKLSSRRREYLLREMVVGGHLLLAGRCASDAGARLPAPLRHELQRLLQDQLTDASLVPIDRYTAGEILDEMGWLPDDLNQWVRCSGCAEDGGDLMATKYPVTNSQFERFIRDDGYERPEFWGGKSSIAWRWRMNEHEDYRGNGSVSQPQHWRNSQFGRVRRGYPVVGVSWFEAAAYAAWLGHILRRARAGDQEVQEDNHRLVVDLIELSGIGVRLPTEREWAAIAGGEKPHNRFPWESGQQDSANAESAVLSRANTRESGIRRTSPVAMYPLGASLPFGLMDMGGNVWEWTGSWHDSTQRDRVFRGGSWYHDRSRARSSIRLGFAPHFSHGLIGFRVVIPLVSGS